MVEKWFGTRVIISSRSRRNRIGSVAPPDQLTNALLGPKVDFCCAVGLNIKNRVVADGTNGR